jgi:hypothetical protein
MNRASSLAFRVAVAAIFLFSGTNRMSAGTCIRSG